MSAVKLLMPKQLFFTGVGASQKLVVTNCSSQKLAIKIRTNHKTALNIQPTHDFIDSQSKKQIVVKLVQLHTGVKLQINYCAATQQMVMKNDSKLTNVDKSQINKQIVLINVEGVKLGSSSTIEQKSQSEDLNSSFSSVMPTKSELKIDRATSLTTSVYQKPLIVVEQHLEEDEQEMQESMKKYKNELQQVEDRVENKKRQILLQKQSIGNSMSENSFMSRPVLLLVLILAFLLGSLIRFILF